MKLFQDKQKTEREKVEERREEVLAKGRKFKYPMQYAKHKLIINTIIVALVAIVLMVIAGWAMLYKFQDTSDMVYRITQVLPVPVAEVAGEKVRCSDYLMIYRSNLITAERQGGQVDGEEAEQETMRQIYKQAAMDMAVEYTYALKLGREMGITVSDEEVTAAFDDHLRVGGVERSEEAFLKILNDNFGMSKLEYRRMLYLNLMKAKVVQAVDDDARRVAEEVDAALAENGNDLLAVAEKLGEAVQYEETGQLVDGMNVDGGRSGRAMKLEPGELSERFLSSNGDGYYYVKLVEKTEKEVNYVSLKIEFLKFSTMVMDLYENDEVKVYINLESADEASEDESGESGEADDAVQEEGSVVDAQVVENVVVESGE